MTPQKTRQEIMHELEEGILPELKKRGRILFISLAGSRELGFPSTNSDYDFKGVYLSPTENFLGLRKWAEKPFDYRGKGLDFYAEEAKHYFHLLANGNGHRFEWPNSQIAFACPNFQEIRQIANSQISRRLLNFYLHFARQTYKGKTQATGAKKDIHTLRAYMTGITLARSRELILDINQLNKAFGYKIIKELIEAKKAGSSYNPEKVSEAARELDKILVAEIDSSALPRTSDFQTISDFLVRLRKSNI